MSRYLIGRVGQALLVLWGAYSITYFILYLLPGDTLSIMLSAMVLTTRSKWPCSRPSRKGVEPRVCRLMWVPG